MRTLAGKMMIGIIKVYQMVISPLFPGSCRYTPTCSEYGVKAISVHGPFKGGIMTVRRIVSCNPWGGRGFDPVPEKKV